MADADEIIAALAMQPHPEGGWYSETFRDGKGGQRGHSTAIYYLLQAGQRSHWHRVKDAAEIWHYYAGAPLALYRCDDGITVETLVLGTDLVRGERPQAIIPALSWQARKALGSILWLVARSRRALPSTPSKWLLRVGNQVSLFDNQAYW